MDTGTASLLPARISRATTMPGTGGHAKIVKDDDGASLSPEMRKQLRQRADDFETMFMTNMLTPMFDTVDVDENFGGGHGEEMFRSLLTNEYAKGITAHGNLGLGNQVYRELLRAQEASNGHG